MFRGLGLFGVGFKGRICCRAFTGAGVGHNTWNRVLGYMTAMNEVKT